MKQKNMVVKRKLKSLKFENDYYQKEYESLNEKKKFFIVSEI